jgi:predicted phage-related endonuclease
MNTITEVARVYRSHHNQMCGQTLVERRFFIGDSDARTIMGTDETALLRLWREKQSEVQPLRQPHRSARTRERGHQSALLRGQYRSGHQGYPAAGTASGRPLGRGSLDSLVEGSGAVFEAKFMLPCSFSEQAAAEKYMPQLQHNMWVVNSKSAVLSVITQGIPFNATLVADPTEACHRLGWQPRYYRSRDAITHAWARRQGGVKTG